MTIYPPEKAWQELYRAALLETDKIKADERIAHAERVIIARSRSLFNNSGDVLCERQALDAAFYALSVLKLYTQAQQSNLDEAENRMLNVSIDARDDRRSRLRQR